MPGDLRLQEENRNCFEHNWNRSHSHELWSMNNHNSNEFASSKVKPGSNIDE